MTGAFYSNLISPMCISFGLLVKPVMNVNRVEANSSNGCSKSWDGKKDDGDFKMTEIEGGKDDGMEDRTEGREGEEEIEITASDVGPSSTSFHGSQAAASAAIPSAVEVDSLAPLNEQQQQQQHQQVDTVLGVKRKAQIQEVDVTGKHDDDELMQNRKVPYLALAGDESSSSSSSSQEAVCNGSILENPWLLRALIQSERMEDSKVDAVNINEAVLLSHAFGLEKVFGSGDMSVTISEFSNIYGEEGGDDENYPQEEKDPEYDIDPYLPSGTDSTPCQQVKLDLSIPIMYMDSYLDMKSVSSAHGHRPPESIHKSLHRVHQGHYCSNMNRLQFDFKILPTLIAMDSAENIPEESQELSAAAAAAAAKNVLEQDTTTTIDLSDVFVDEDKEVEKWTRDKIRAAGAGGISLDFLKALYDEESRCASESSSSNSSSSSSGDNSNSCTLPGGEADDNSSSSSISNTSSSSDNSNSNSTSINISSIEIGGNSNNSVSVSVSVSSCINRCTKVPTEADLLAIGKMLARKKKIIMDSGSGFNEISLRCIETTEKHPIHFVDSSFSHLYVLETSPTIYPEEGSCPWVSVTGHRNELFYRMLRSKVASILSQRPGSSLTAIHAAFPQINVDQMSLLLSTMAKEKILFAQAAVSSRVLSSPFQRRSTSTPSVGYFLHL